MIDWKRWLPGMPDDEEEDPVQKTLRALGQGASDVGAGISQGVSDLGSSIGSGFSTANEALGSAATAVRDAYAVPAEERPPQYSGPSYAQPSLAPGQPSMLEHLPAVGAEYGRAAQEALGDRGALLAGMRPPETPEEVVAANAPAPFRAVRAASEIGSAAGSAALGEYGARAAGEKPIFVTNEIQTPLGAIPSVEGPTPRQVGSAIGTVVGDPTNLILPGTAADRAASVAIEEGAGALRGAAGRAVGSAAEALGAALGRNAENVGDAPGVRYLGSGVVPETGAPRPGWTPPPTIPDEEIVQFRRAAKLVENGQPIPPDLPVITRPMPARERGADPHDLHFFVTSAGEEVVLPPANRGTPGRGINAAYSDYISAQGGHRGRPSGRYQDPSGEWHQYDSPQELLFMQHFDEQKARGPDPRAEHGGIESWWRGGESPYPEIESLPYVKTTMKPGEQPGVGGFEGDYVVRHHDGFVELVEGKDVKVMPKQEEWFQEPGKRPALAWNVLRKSAAAIPELAMQGRGFRMLTGRESAAMVPSLAPSPLTGKGSPVKSFQGVPGVDWRDIPELDRGFPGAGPAVGNQILDVVTATEREARALAARLQAAGVPADEQRAQLTRLVRDRLLPTADLAGRTTGEMRNVQGRVSAAVPAWDSDAGRVTQEQLERHWPDAAAAIRSAEQNGAQVRSATVELVQSPADAAPSPRLFIETDGDPAAIQRLAAQLGQLHGDPGAATVWHYDWQGPTSVREVSFSGADPAIQASFDDVQAALRGAGDGVPGLVSRYNDDGSLATVHVLGQDAAGNPVPDDLLDARLHRMQEALQTFGIRADVGPPQRAVVRNFAAEGDYARALELHEQSLGLRPLPSPPRGAVRAGDGGGAAGRAGADRGAGPGAAGAAADRLADLDRAPPDTPAAGLGSGLVGRLSAGFGNAAQGAVLGAASEDLQAQQEDRDPDPTARLARGVAGAGLGYVAGRGARGLGRAGEAGLGSGLVPRANQGQIAAVAGQVAQTPMTGAHTNGQHVTRNVARQIQKQAAAGVPPVHPTGPMAPPNPPPGWWDHVENWRYNLGLFAQLSTGMVQLAGGVVQAAGGGAAEALRLGVLKGQPEALLPIAGEAIRSLPGGIKSAALTAAGQVPKAIQAGSDYKPPLHAREFAQGNVGRGVGALAVAFPGQLTTQAPDALWHEMFYKTGIAQAAADEARRQAGGSPMAMGERLRIQKDLIANPTPEIVDEATKLAQNATYKGEAGRVLGAPKKITEALGPVGSFFMPIYNTIARIHEQALEYTPGVGLLPLDKLGLAPKGQARPMSRRIAQQAVGASLVVGGLSYAAEGGIRGPGPSNPNEAQGMRDQGYTPNTTNVGGYWIPNSWFGPWGPILNEIGAVNDARIYDHGDKGWDDLTWEKKAASIIKMSGRAAADYPALDTAQTITKLFTAPEDALPSFLGEVAAQYIPGPLRTKAQAEDTKARTRTRGADVPFEQRFWETVKQRSGYGRQELPVAQDILGRDVENPRQGWARALAPNIREEKPDPIIQAYLDAGLNIGDPATELTLPSLKDTDLKPQLTPEETRRWNTLRGEAIIRRVEPMLADPAFAAQPLDARAKGLEKMRTAAAEEAHARLRSEIGAQEINRRISEAQATKQRRQAS